MTEPANSSDAFTGVVMGKTVSAALAGEGAAEFVPSKAVKIDGGALVARVLQSQNVKYLFAVNGGLTWPIREFPISLVVQTICDPVCIRRGKHSTTYV